MKSRQPRKPQGAFTLIEILIVVAIIGILAAILIPRYVDASSEAQESAVKHDLQTLREQIEYYRFKENAWPASLQAMVDDGYLSVFPEHPGEGDWNYNPATGEITSTVDGSW